MTMCQLYGYVFYRVFMRERERERDGFRRAEKQTKFTAAHIFLCSQQLLRSTIMATKYGSLNTSLSQTFNLIYHQRHQRGNDKYYTTVSRATASTALFLVVEHKGERLVTHQPANHKNIFSVINMANSLQLFWLQLQRHGFIERGRLSSIILQCNG